MTNNKPITMEELVEWLGKDRQKSVDWFDTCPQEGVMSIVECMSLMVQAPDPEIKIVGRFAMRGLVDSYLAWRSKTN